MTTMIKHDESIEALAGNKMAENGHKQLTNQEEGKGMLPKSQSDSEKQQELDHKKRIARIKKLVFVIGGIIIVAAVVLVGVTLFMAGHIDEEVRKSSTDDVTVQPDSGSSGSKTSPG